LWLLTQARLHNPNGGRFCCHQPCIRSSTADHDFFSELPFVFQGEAGRLRKALISRPGMLGLFPFSGDAVSSGHVWHVKLSAPWKHPTMWWIAAWKLSRLITLWCRRAARTLCKSSMRLRRQIVIPQFNIDQRVCNPKGTVGRVYESNGVTMYEVRLPADPQRHSLAQDC
jgi:hypothetical protein